MKPNRSYLLVLSLVATLATGFSQSISLPTNVTSATPPQAMPAALPTTMASPAKTSETPPALHSAFSQLTPAEREQLMKAHQKALQDPAVQSTRQIARMALHKAMLRIDPSIETIFADMDAHGPKDAVAVNTEEKALGGHFDKWANNIPPKSRAVLTPEDRTKLRTAHDQAMKDPTVMEARKTARVTLYNAMINADPLITPVLNKAGIKPPSNVETSMQHSAIGSEERILGGNGPKWDKDVLAPAVKKQEQTDATAAANNLPTNGITPVMSPAATAPATAAPTPATSATPISPASPH